MASLACQTIMDPITDSSELEPEILIEPLATDFLEELEPESLIEPETIDPLEGSDSGDVILQDSFDDPSSGWEVGDYDAGSVGYTSDAYSVISSGNGSFMWGLAFRQFDDVVIEVETEQIRGPANDNNGYGVMCRVQENGDGYLFLISGDGFFSITKASNDDFIPLIDWTSSDAIQMGNSTNQIQAICDGSNLDLEVNGQQLASTQDSEFATGDIAMAATTFEDDTTEVHFDNLVVTAP
jgi:hypothetical protein